MNSLTRNKTFMYAVLLIGAIGIVLGMVFLNGYLKSNNMLLYATGTKDKAFMELNWEMSVNEVERASDKQIIDETASFSCIFVAFEFESVERRVSCYQDDDVYLFGKQIKVTYDFFDNRLFKYELLIPVYGYSDVSKLLEQLEQRFGEDFLHDVKSIPEENTQKYSRELSTEKEKVRFILYIPSKNQLKDESYQFEGKENSNSARVFLEVTYLPMIKKIQDEIEVEESSYF